MSDLERGADLWLAWMLPASWQLCLFIAIVALASWLLRPLSARLRYGLWLLVLVKVFLPPGLSAPWSLGNTAVSPLVHRPATALQVPVTDPLAGLPGGSSGGPRVAPEQRAAGGLPLPAVLLFVWAAGCLGLWSYVAWRYLRLSLAVRASEAIDEGPLRVALEQAALQLRLKPAADLYQTDLQSSPFLFGLVNPRIVVPRQLAQSLSVEELQAVLLHELTHWKRGDTWVGWLQLLAQGLFWFHPVVWWANHQLRHARESACDESVLQLESLPPQQYGETLLRVLTAARGRSVVAGSLVGVFERGTKLQNRLEEIMSYEPKKRRFGWVSRAAVAMFAALFLPMAGSFTEPASGTAGAARAAAEGDDPAATGNTPYPRIVDTQPKSGAAGVERSTAWISVTFDRPMQKGMSWTGGPPHFPPLDKSREAHWKDDRTCLLPVQLQQGQYYRLGINSQSFQNFCSADGTATPPAVICFTTEGASQALERRVRAPQVVEIEPNSGADDVDPATKVLRVTFNMKMAEGFSWTGGGEHFPTIPEGERPRWSRDGRTCLLPVELKPDWSYELGLNSLSHNNFQSQWGIPLEPVVYRFSTGGAD